MLDLSLVLTKAQISFSAGVKAFSKGNLIEAEKSLDESLSINPQNPIAHWNLARVSIISGRSRETVIGYYCRAIDLIPDVGLRKKVKSELDRFTNGRLDANNRAPITEV